jgi:hypothetical protein
MVLLIASKAICPAQQGVIKVDHDVYDCQTE